MGFFKRLLIALMEEEIEEPVNRPPAPCGDDETHYYWTEEEGYPCPKCYHKEEEKEEVRKMQQFARIMADELRKHNM